MLHVVQALFNDPNIVRTMDPIGPLMVTVRVDSVDGGIV